MFDNYDCLICRDIRDSNNRENAEMQARWGGQKYARDITNDHC